MRVVDSMNLNHFHDEIEFNFRRVVISLNEEMYLFVNFHCIFAKLICSIFLFLSFWYYLRSIYNMYRYIGTRKLIIYRNVSKLNYLIKTTLSCYFYITITFNLQKCITIIFAISNLTYASHELLEVALLTSSLTNSATSLPLPLPYFKAARGKEIENEMIPSYSCKWIVVQAHMRFTVINKRSYSFHVCVPFSRENAVSRLRFRIIGNQFRSCGQKWQRLSRKFE